MRTYWLPGKTAREKRSWQGKFTPCRGGKGRWWFRWTWVQLRKPFSKVSYSVTWKGLSPMHGKTVSGNSRRQTKVRYFWMKSETCHTPCNPSYWQPCKVGRWSAWDRINRSTSTSVWSVPRIATYPGWSKKVPSGKIYFIASTRSTWKSPRYGKEGMIFCYWQRPFYGTTAGNTGNPICPFPVRPGNGC